MPSALGHLSHTYAPSRATQESATAAQWALHSIIRPLLKPHVWWMTSGYFATSVCYECRSVIGQITSLPNDMHGARRAHETEDERLAAHTRQWKAQRAVGVVSSSARLRCDQPALVAGCLREPIGASKPSAAEGRRATPARWSAPSNGRHDRGWSRA